MPFDAHLLLTVPRFQIGAAGGGTIWHRQTVQADPRALLAGDDADRAATEALIGQLYRLDRAYVGGL